MTDSGGRAASGRGPGRPVRRPSPGPRRRPVQPPAGSGGATRRRWPLLLAAVTSALVLLTSGAGWAWVTYLDGQIERVDPFDGLGDRPGTGASDDLNFLVVGTDTRTGVAKETLERMHAGGASCDCTDTMLLVHLSASHDRATVVSIPRDSYVEFPAHRDRTSGRQVGPSRGKINSAYTLGGPSLAVATVEQATGVRVDHYVEVNFLSFVSTVDTLGGVPLCTPVPLHDPKSGLDLPAGTTRLDGVRALQYVRARHVQGDPTGDLGRMRRQQNFITQVLAAATGSGTLSDPLRLNRVVSSVLGSIKVDRGLSSQDMVALGSRLRNLGGSGVTYAQIPFQSVDFQVPGWGSTVVWDAPRAAELFAAIRDDRVPPAASAKPAPGSTPAAPAGVGPAGDRRPQAAGPAAPATPVPQAAPGGTAAPSAPATHSSQAVCA